MGCDPQLAAYRYGRGNVGKFGQSNVQFPCMLSPRADRCLPWPFMMYFPDVCGGSLLVSINEVNLRWAQLVLGRVTVSWFNSQCGTFISICN